MISYDLPTVVLAAALNPDLTIVEEPDGSLTLVNERTDRRWPLGNVTKEGAS